MKQKDLLEPLLVKEVVVFFIKAKERQTDYSLDLDQLIQEKQKKVMISKKANKVNPVGFFAKLPVLLYNYK